MLAPGCCPALAGEPRAGVSPSPGPVPGVTHGEPRPPALAGAPLFAALTPREPGEEQPPAVGTGSRDPFVPEQGHPSPAVTPADEDNPKQGLVSGC